MVPKPELPLPSLLLDADDFDGKQAELAVAWINGLLAPLNRGSTEPPWTLHTCVVGLYVSPLGQLVPYALPQAMEIDDELLL